MKKPVSQNTCKLGVYVQQMKEIIAKHNVTIMTSKGPITSCKEGTDLC